MVHEEGVAHEVLLVLFAAVDGPEGIKPGVPFVHGYFAQIVAVQGVLVRVYHPVVVAYSVGVVLHVGPFVGLGVEYLHGGVYELLAGHQVQVLPVRLSLEGETAVVVYPEVSGAAFPGGDHYDAVGRLCAPDGCRGGVLEEVHALNVVGVHHTVHLLAGHGHAVHNEQRFLLGIDGRYTSYKICDAVGGFRDVETGCGAFEASEHVTVDVGLVTHGRAGNIGERTCGTLPGDGLVTGHHHLVDELPAGLQNQIQAGPSLDGNVHFFHTYIGNGKYGIGPRDFQGPFSVLVGDGADGCAFHQDACAFKGIAFLVGDDAAHAEWLF